jgi:hypothetical protein
VRRSPFPVDVLVERPSDHIDRCLATFLGEGDRIAEGIYDQVQLGVAKELPEQEVVEILHSAIRYVESGLRSNGPNQWDGVDGTRYSKWV